MNQSSLPPFLLAAIQQSDFSIAITTDELDPPGPVFVHVNDAFTRMTGYAREELLGATPRILQGPDTDRAVLDRLKSNLQAGDSFEGRAWNYRKDGTPYLVEWTITRLRDDGEGGGYFFAVLQEITDQAPDWPQWQGQTRRLNSLLNSSGAKHDPVTGALNHQSMLLRLQRRIDESAASRSVNGLVSLQLRQMDRIDQAFGVEVINQVVSDIAERLGNALEAEESLARTHEYTFAVIIPVGGDAASDPDQHLMTRARSFVAAVSEREFEVEGERLWVKVSAGIARAPTDGRHARELALLAEELTTEANNDEADSVRWANHDIKEAQRQRIKLESDLQSAISEKKLVLFYQPIIDLETGKAVGAEALLRWPRDEAEARIGPDQFIPLAEELELMDELGVQVFEDACRQLRRWQSLPGNDTFWVSVNVSPTQLRDPGLADSFLAITRATGVVPACVKLEITENALEFNLDEVSDVIDELVAAGFSLALDDFGTGYSSLGRLIDMPFNLIKVDKTFVWQAPDGRGAGVVASLSQLSRYLRIDALGEGVETATQEAFLRTLNYRYAQGFHYARPMSAVDFSAWAGWPAG